jgi:hypothetical protein
MVRAQARNHERGNIGLGQEIGIGVGRSRSLCAWTMYSRLTNINQHGIDWIFNHDIRPTTTTIIDSNGPVQRQRFRMNPRINMSFMYPSCNLCADAAIAYASEGVRPDPNIIETSQALDHRTHGSDTKRFNET